MISVDTNVIVRLITMDDKKQAERAAKAIQSGRVFIAHTVLLETYWVLSRAYGLDRETILQAIRNLIGLDNVVVENLTVTSHAIEACQNGLDFADALHVASSRSAIKFVTFDRDLVKKSKKEERLIPISEV